MQATEARASELEGVGGTTRRDGEDVWNRTRQLAKFRSKFVWPILLTSLVIYFGILICILSMSNVMSVRLYGDVNIGLLAVCAQLLVTIATFWAYCAWASAHFDNRARELFDAALRDQKIRETQ